MNFTPRQTLNSILLVLLLSSMFTTPATAAGPKSPKILSGFTSSERMSLMLAFGSATRKIQKQPSCSALFDNLDLKGLEALSRTYYEPAATASDRALCARGAVALSGLNGRRTRLCDSFNTHSRRDQTAHLIHEALHIAGMSEKPVDPYGLTPHEITTAVKTACRL